MLHTGDGTADTPAVLSVAPDVFLARRREAGLQIAGHHGADVDAERRDLAAQRTAVGIDRRLCRRIIRLKRDGDRRGDAADMDDSPAARAAHARQNGMVHIDDAEEIDVEQTACLLGRGALHCARDTEARVVHHKVDPPGLRLDGGDRSLHSVRVRDIAGQRRHAGHRRAVPRQGIHPKALFRQRLRRGKAQAGGPSGHNCSFHRILSGKMGPLRSAAAPDRFR